MQGGGSVVALLVVVVLGCVVLSALAQKPINNVVAYYTFDANPATAPYSGVCPSLDLPDGVWENGTAAYTTSISGFGNAASFPGSTATATNIYLGNWKVGSAQNQLTLTARVYPKNNGNYGVVAKGHGDLNHQVWGLNVQNYKAGFTIQLAPPTGPSMIMNAQQGGMNSLSSNTWAHLAGVYDGTQVVLYVNGASAKSMPATGTISETSDPNVIGNAYNPSQNPAYQFGFSGYIDEVRIYNYALSPTEVLAEYNAGSGRLPPTISFSANTTVDVPVSQDVLLDPIVTVPDPPIIFEGWTVTSGGCNTVDIANATQSETDITTKTLGTFGLEFDVYDSLLCASLELSVVGVGASPQVSTPLPTEFFVPNGFTATLTAMVTGYPVPTFAWQEYVFLPAIGRREMEENENGRMTQHDISIVHQRYLEELAVERDILCDPPNITSDCFEWISINQTTSTYTSPVGSAGLNGTIIRLFASNFAGSYTSAPITIVVVSGSSVSTGMLLNYLPYLPPLLFLFLCFFVFFF